MATPRVFIIRHGETEWSLDGRHTGRTELPLTSNGEKRILATGHALVGADRLITPSALAHIYVSPRQRAQKTLSLLLGSTSLNPQSCHAETTITPLLAEWDYGAYEGLTSTQIRARRAERGLDGAGETWDIWRDGCEGGESPQDVADRCDRLIAEIRERWHRPAVKGGEREGEKGDVLLVAHGHLLRAFAMRWIGKNLDDTVPMLLEAGGVGTLSYEHGRVEEPAILLGGSFVVEVVERIEHDHRRESDMEQAWRRAT